MENTGLKLVKNLDTILKNKLTVKFTEAIEKIKEVTIAKYDEELLDVVTDRNSKTNPNFYREDFIERLDKFSYLNKSENTVTISTPDMETFDFSGRMRVIETIMEGTAGLYVEVNEEDYKKIFGKRPVNQEPLDDYVPTKERIYIIRYTGVIKKAERSMKKKFVRYPFSNTPPIKILEIADKFIDDNMDIWIKDAIEDAQKEFASGH